MAGAAHGDFHVSHTGVELSKTFAEIAASCGAVDGCGATQAERKHRRKQAWISVYTSIQILARAVKRFTPALCEQVDWHSGATGLQKTISPLEQDGIHCLA